ncbi:putative phage abortive infection protein [Sphingomonas bisphenolicum]
MKPSQVIFAVVICALVWGAWANHGAEWAVSWTAGANDAQLTRAAQWGDSFGVINAFTSGLGFTVVFFTLIMQARALRDQAADLHRQRFESSFFELLKLMRELRQQVQFHHSHALVMDSGKGMSPDGAKKIKSRLGEKKTDLIAFDAIIREYAYWYKKNPDRGSLQSDEKKKFIASVYDDKIHKVSESTISPYFRIIYTILYRIKSDKYLIDKEKFQYSNLLRSQLTSRELTVLALNATSNVSKDMFEHVCHFRLLKYYPESGTRQTLMSIYPAEAFMPRD